MEAGNDEKYVNADEPARQARDTGMEKNDRSDRDCTQSIDIGTIGGTPCRRCR